MNSVQAAMPPAVANPAFSAGAKKAIELFCPTLSEKQAFDLVTSTYRTALSRSSSSPMKEVEEALDNEFTKNHRMRPLARVALVIACLFTLCLALIYLPIRNKRERELLLAAKRQFRQASASIESTCLSLLFQTTQALPPTALLEAEQQRLRALQKQQALMARAANSPMTRKVGLSLWRKGQDVVRAANLRTDSSGPSLQWHHVVASVNPHDPQAAKVTRELHQLPDNVKAALLSAERIAQAAEKLGYTTFTHGQSLEVSTLNLLQAVHNERDLIGFTRRRMRLPTPALPYSTAADFRLDFDNRVARNPQFEDNQLAGNVISADAYHLNMDEFESALYFTSHPNIAQSATLFTQLTQSLMRSLLPSNAQVGRKTLELLQKCEQEVGSLMQQYQGYRSLTVIGVAREDLHDDKKRYVEVAHRRGRACDCTVHSKKSGHARTLDILTQMRAHKFQRCRHYSPVNKNIFNPQVRILPHNLDRARRRLVSTVEIMPDATRQQYHKAVGKIRFKLRTIKLVGELCSQSSSEQIFRVLARMRAHSDEPLMQAFFTEYFQSLQSHSKQTHDHIRTVLNTRLGQLKGALLTVRADEHDRRARLESNMQEILLSPFFR